MGLACGDEVAPSTRVCAEILALQVPGSEVVETWPGAGAATFAYRIEGEDVASVHHLGCVVEEPTAGRLRAKSVRVDGRDLSEAELLFLNAELLLAEIRRADPGPPAAQPWTEWLEGALATLWQRWTDAAVGDTSLITQWREGKGGAAPPVPGVPR